MGGFIFSIFFENTVQHRRSHKHTYTHLYERTHAHPYPYEHLRRTEPADLEVDEVTTGASLLTGTSRTTKRIAPDNPGINPGKCKRPYQV
jgi:hypothetical protein